MERVTPEQCQEVVRERSMQWLGHHKCGGCGVMVGYEFAHCADGSVLVGFQSSCDCGAPYHAPEPRTWEDFADAFNIQTPENRAEMWERFKAGKPTHERSP